MPAATIAASRARARVLRLDGAGGPSVAVRQIEAAMLVGCTESHKKLARLRGMVVAGHDELATAADRRPIFLFKRNFYWKRRDL